MKVTIADAGLLQPILVCRTGDDTYEVVDGARRLAALRELGVRELIVGRDIVMDAEERSRFPLQAAHCQRAAGRPERDRARAGFRGAEGSLRLPV